MEPWAVLLKRVTAVQDQHVQLDVQIVRIPETQDRRNYAGAHAQMRFDDGVERRGLQLMTTVAVACADDPVAESSFHRTMMASEGRLAHLLD